MALSVGPLEPTERGALGELCLPFQDSVPAAMARAPWHGSGKHSPCPVTSPIEEVTAAGRAGTSGSEASVLRCLGSAFEGS